jgi:hypothetical protein
VSLTVTGGGTPQRRPPAQTACGDVSRHPMAQPTAGSNQRVRGAVGLKLDIRLRLVRSTRCRRWCGSAGDCGGSDGPHGRRRPARPRPHTRTHRACRGQHPIPTVARVSGRPEDTQSTQPGTDRGSSFAPGLRATVHSGQKTRSPADHVFAGQQASPYGGADGVRTRDPHTASVVRYQLRYSPVR